MSFQDNSTTYLVDNFPVDSQRVNADSFVVLSITTLTLNQAVSHYCSHRLWIKYRNISVYYVITALVLTVIARQVVKH